ncbi:PIN/TRAM domain-containing protein [Jeotgalibaca ciconiae]|uniref:PIN/TRAM domain-containing protein n=1 Tax=Jeotgalibaca ciconiae TaxID=2496265 RepID=A0A3S9H9Z3_9LACT|nr:PIN/TRAM domain-containing protein [Jeotgalibaca ciconiae]AZP04200.1 PIN/TRAM domain-containing protein [Jeotgalibaca ciconiae]HJB23025.1 PIN/TRAM domain-containing protein [Candidatus Jeotgalibaca pullicola]
MKKRIISFIFLIIGGSIGLTLMPYFWELLNIENSTFNNQFVNFGIGALIFLLLSLLMTNFILDVFKKIENYFSKQSASFLLFGALGIIIGLILAWLVGIPLAAFNISIISNVVPSILSIVFAYLGFYIGTTRIEDFRKLFTPKTKRPDEGVLLERKADNDFRKYKILDTSVIIDGRIYEIAKTGFLEGVLVIPNFVLRELQYIADSSDSLKRVRGRRGLDILNSLQKEEVIPVESYDGEFEEIAEVDSKLIRLAKLIDGVIITNDYNLNKVSEFQNVPVLNINELANAVKPVVIPGENMTVTIVKAGTERNQGVAYLDDGTMIVVEDGQHYMNKTIGVVVTSALQTAAGRMIFAKPAHSQKGIKNN